MTLIVGIIARDAIIMGSDSQLTSGNHKEINRWKITCLPFGNRSVLVAESGSSTLSAQAVDFLGQKCVSMRVADSETVPNLVTEAVRHVRTHQMSLYPRQDYRPQEWKEFFMEQASFELTVAYYDHQAIPRLFSIDVSECVIQKAKEHFLASGCGAELGQCLLFEHTKAAMPQDLAVAMAIHTIETVIKYDPYCGRPVRIGVLGRPGPIAGEIELAAEQGLKNMLSLRVLKSPGTCRVALIRRH